MKIFKYVGLILIFTMVTFGVSYAMGQFFFTENPLIGKQAPDFTLKTTQGKDLNFNEYRAGNSSIVFFWATWCPHCRAQLKELNENSEKIQVKGIKLVLVDLGENSQQVQSYLQKQNINFEVFLDEKEEVSEVYSIIGVPTFFFVNKKGIVKAVEHALPENYEQILMQE